MIWKKLLQGLNVGKGLKTVTGSIDKKVKVKAISLMGGGGAPLEDSYSIPREENTGIE